MAGRMDLAEFERRVAVEHRMLLVYARALGGGSAEDIVQEACVTAYLRREDFRPDGDFGAWLRGIVRFKTLEWRRARRFAPLDEDTLAGVDSALSAWMRYDRHYSPLDALHDCLHTLSAQLRESVHRFYTLGESVAAIAAALGCSQAAIKKRLQRGRDRLAACIDERLRRARECQR